MTNYTITQSRKGGRATAAQSRRHDDAIIHRLLTDGYANEETSKIIARETSSVVAVLRKYDTDDAKRIRRNISSISVTDADEWIECADWLYDARRDARRGNWSDPELAAEEKRAMAWAMLMRRVRYVAMLTAAVRSVQISA